MRKEPTGAPTGFRSDVVATAKRALKAGEVLDGEGGFCVWGKQMPAERSLAEGLLPLGLAHQVRLKRDLAEGECLRWSDVDYDANDLAVKVRREMEAAFGRPNAAGPPRILRRAMRMTISAAAAAARLSAPAAGLPARAPMSAAAARAFSASREPMMTSWPAAASRKATPVPCAPVPPRTAILYVCRSPMTFGRQRPTTNRSSIGIRLGMKCCSTMYWTSASSVGRLASMP